MKLIALYTSFWTNFPKPCGRLNTKTMNFFSSLFTPLHRAWSKSLRRQLAWSFSLSVLSLVITAGSLLFAYQRDFLYTQGNDNALKLASAVAYSSRVWLLSDDLVGLQEVLHSVEGSTDLRFAVILSPLGEIMASTPPEYIDKSFNDPLSQSLLTRPHSAQILINAPNLIDVAYPIQVEDRFIGWVRIELSRQTANANLTKMRWAGIIIGLLLILLIVTLARLLARRMTRGLTRLMAIAQDPHHQLDFLQEEIERPDEIGDLARKLNQMLNSIEHEQQEKRDSEARYRVVFNHAMTGLAQVSTTGQFLQINSEFCRIINYSQAEILSKSFTFQQITHPDDLESDLAHVQALLNGDGDSYTLEKRYIRRDGEIVWVILSVYLLRDMARTPLYFISSILDITERKQAEIELAKYKNHLEELVIERTDSLILARQAADAANQAKSVFLANMSHELRTPLNAILGFSSLLRREENLTPDQKDKLNIVNRSGEHLLTLINDVLEMAKIEAGQIAIRHESFDLGNMVRDVIDMMSVRAHEKGLYLHIDQTSRFPRYIKSDEARIRQILVNLIGNAIKFTQHGGVTLRLNTHENHTTHLVIEIEDTGIGIKSIDQSAIFEPFVQRDEDASQKGTGLGLTITRQFVQLIGGTLTMTSVEGVGSIFKVNLPVEKIAASDVIQPHKLGLGEALSLAAGQPEYRILIVEDQLENQLLLAQLMKNMGFQVKIAENGEQGVRLFKSWHPHFIWMDRRMPVMDGLEATRHIRALPDGKAVKIVAVTASVMMEQHDEILASGMDGLLRKPYRASELYDCLAQQLGVKYIYAAPDAPSAELVLTTEMMATLPLGLRLEMAEALNSLDNSRIEAVIQLVEPHDHNLYKILHKLSENFNYPAIQSALLITDTPQ